MRTSIFIQTPEPVQTNRATFVEQPSQGRKAGSSLGSSVVARMRKMISWLKVASILDWKVLVLLPLIMFLIVAARHSVYGGFGAAMMIALPLSGAKAWVHKSWIAAFFFLVILGVNIFLKSWFSIFATSLLLVWPAALFLYYKVRTRIGFFREGPF
jgi:hypothetical protein